MRKQKDGFLYRGISSIYVYLIIAVIGFIIVLCMTSFLKNQVKDLMSSSISESK